MIYPWFFNSVWSGGGGGGGGGGNIAHRLY